MFSDNNSTRGLQIIIKQLFSLAIHTEIITPWKPMINIHSWISIAIQRST